MWGGGRSVCVCVGGVSGRSECVGGVSEGGGVSVWEE